MANGITIMETKFICFRGVYSTILHFLCCYVYVLIKESCYFGGITDSESHWLRNTALRERIFLPSER